MTTTRPSPWWTVLGAVAFVAVIMLGFCTTH